MHGVSLLAIGKPAYGSWAYNLARSLRAFHPDIRIQLVHDQQAVKNVDTSVFTQMREIHKEDAYRGGKLNPSYAKLKMIDYYPLEWDKVMFLDVDALAIDLFEDLFLRLDSDYKIHTWGITDQLEGVFGNMLWMRIERMREVFNLPNQPIPGTNSSFQLMKLTDTTEKIYRRALEAFYHFEENCSVRDLNMTWGKRKVHNPILPDELFFNVALADETGYDGWKPILFHKTGDGHLDLGKAKKDGKRFIGYWGDRGYNSLMSRTLYDGLVGKYTGVKNAQIDRLMKEKFVNYN